MPKNKVLLEGNLVRDPEVKFLTSGNVVTTFSLACNEEYESGGEKKKEVYYFDVETWGKLAEQIVDGDTGFVKGNFVCIEGKLKQQRWKDSADQSPRSKVVIVAFKVEKVVFEKKPDGKKKDDAGRNASSGPGLGAR